MINQLARASKGKEKIDGIDINCQIDSDISVKRIMLANYVPSDFNIWNSQIEHKSAQEVVIVRHDYGSPGQTEAPKGAYLMEMLADDLV